MMNPSITLDYSQDNDDTIMNPLVRTNPNDNGNDARSATRGGEDPSASASARRRPGRSQQSHPHGHEYSNINNNTNNRSNNDYEYDNDDGKKRQRQQYTAWSSCVACVASLCHYRKSSRHPKFDQDTLDALYYRDDFNDSSWACSLGTSSEDHGLWMNTSDQAGTIMSILVWVLLGYSALTITFLAQTGGIPWEFSMVYDVLCCLALASHVKTTLTDPGSVPQSAVPTEVERRKNTTLSMCSQCQTYKPPFSHHCRICNRCISRMDHHCPWMNNCIGAGNMKHFILFLVYTWACSGLALLLLGWNYFFCAQDKCTFTFTLTQLSRVMMVLSVGAFLFTSSMLMNVSYGIMTGIGTIDRLKKKANGTFHDAEEESIPLEDIFGFAPLYTWPFPTDPLFPNYDQVMGYSTSQRLLREQMNPQRPMDIFTDTASYVSSVLPV
mmetsp:Transcript_5674/g.8263  ORF Transcript_5674/g.8263 Transcript_5674/m.8263 type:complete len:439 (-) Transcript_5674:1141-2457(-)